jgi:hypothetical protein
MWCRLRSNESQRKGNIKANQSQMRVVIAIYYNYYVASVRFLPPTLSSLPTVHSSLYRSCPCRSIWSEIRPNNWAHCRLDAATSAALWCSNKEDCRSAPWGRRSLCFIWEGSEIKEPVFFSRDGLFIVGERVWDSCNSFTSLTYFTKTPQSATWNQSNRVVNKYGCNEKKRNATNNWDKYIYNSFSM